MEWSDVRIFLAIAQAGTLGAAARKLGLTQPTMGRRLRALEAVLGQTLFQRTADGFILTDEGNAMLGPAERMAEEAAALERALTGAQQGLSGSLRLSSSDWFGAHILAPLLAEFSRANPAIRIELLTDSRLLSLAQREADLVFRITPFTEPEVIARKLMHIDYGFYGTAPPTSEARLIAMDEAFGGMPDVAWLQRVLPKAEIVLRSNNRDVQAQFCLAGGGLAVLPRPLGDKIPGLTMFDLGEAPPGRDTWVGYHRDLRRLPRLRALMAALDRL